MAMILNAIAALLLVFGPQPTPAPAAPPPLTIAPGETVTARVSDDGAFLVVIAREPASAGTGDPPAPAENTLRFTFTRTDGNQRMLYTQNGYGRSFHFAAKMFLGKHSARTSICSIPPHLASFEQWPHPIDRLELSAPTLSVGDAGSISCV